MTKYILRRLIMAIPILLGITIIDFALINLAPGDPIDAMIDPTAAVNVAAQEALREKMGLNQPLPVRYGIWLREMATGNMGYSYVKNVPVAERIRDRLGATLLLTSSALLISVLIGIPLGILSALKQYSWLDYLLTFFAFAGISVPNFFLALGGIYIFSLKLGVLPPFGMVSLRTDLPRVIDILYHLILPATVLGLASVGSLMRFARTSLLEVVGMDYITTARAKGLREKAIVSGHALRNALIPLITILGLRIPGLFGGSVIIESVFSWPGIGQLAIESITDRDYPQIMGLLLISAVLILLANLFTDILYAYADPRIRYEES
ncbi:ABC transporter permease [Chloroflexi bacterium TSY]|nr:ABC transporter permease [Chloroflexi bacterium TSY]